MELLTSEKLTLPQVYFISDRSKIKEIPIGVPFIYGDYSIKKNIVRILEYEVLFQSAVKTGFPFKFKEILKEQGYDDLYTFHYTHPAYFDVIKSDEDYFKLESLDLIKSKEEIDYSLQKFIRDSSAYVDIKKIKELNVFPVWMDDVEQSLTENIHNFALFNPNMYNKKLEGMYGAIELTSPSRNLIIIDISGSIPKAVSSTCLTLAKFMGETFYADILITGSKSTLYFYENLSTLNVEKMYYENGTDNDQIWFKELLSSDVKKYKTVIVFGDNHHPGAKWSNEFNRNAKNITDKDGKKLCKWKVDNIISFHTSSSKELAGYARWFTTDNIKNIKNWVKYLN